MKQFNIFANAHEGKNHRMFLVAHALSLLNTYNLERPELHARISYRSHIKIKYMCFLAENRSVPVSNDLERQLRLRYISID